MPTSENIKSEIERLLAKARALTPKDFLDPLPPDESLGGVPAWREFEHQIWAIGEDIRRLLLKNPRLRSDVRLQVGIMDVACDRRAHRGRQPFVMLLGYRSCAGYSGRLAGHLDDSFVNGHVISTLYKMRASGHSRAIRAFLVSKVTWVRDEAKRYLAWDGASSKPL